MKLSETLVIFRRIKGNWPRQPADDATIAEWSDCLRDASFEAAMAAVSEWRNRGEAEPPTPGQLRKFAKEIEQRLLDEQRRRRRALNEPRPSEEERARVVALIRQTREMLESRKAVVVVESSAPNEAASREIDSETRRAQERIEARRKKLARTLVGRV